MTEIRTRIDKRNDTIADPFASAADIARVIHQRPVLAAMLLRVVI